MSFRPYWKGLVRSQGGDPVSPAFSMLEQRVTLMDGGLFTGSASRNKELLERFGMTGPNLLNLAITHEMGHAICQEKDERRADDYGRELRDGKIPDCSKTPGGSRPACHRRVDAVRFKFVCHSPRDEWDKANQSQPLVLAIRAASTRLPAPSLLIASDR